MGWLSELGESPHDDLPPSKLNPIETEWHQLKTHELKGPMFNYELDLAYSMTEDIDAGGYKAERLRFPSQLAS